MGKIVGISLIVLAIAIFWSIFFKLCPFIIRALPQSEWHNFLAIVIYAVVGYLGGIGIPLALLVWGIISLID